MQIDMITLVNFLLCLAIVAMGLFGYRRSRHALPLMLAIVFSLFAVSHLLILFGAFDDLDMVIFGLRVAAYGLVLYLLYRYVQVLNVF